MNYCYQNKKSTLVFYLPLLLFSLWCNTVFSQTPTYCSVPSSDCSFDDEIKNVKMGTLNNSSSGCSGTAYTDYSASVAAPTFNRGSTVPISVTIGPGGNDSVAVWIDYNQDGIFQSSEYSFIGGAKTNVNATITNNIIIANSALGGFTRMRVRVKFFPSSAPNNVPWTGDDACKGFQYSETEDYKVNIDATCNIPTLPILSADTVLCGSGSANLRVTGGDLNTATQWVWYAGGCGSGTPVGTGTSITVTPTATTTYYVRGEGGCATGGSCVPVTVIVSSIPGLPSITPVTPICINSIQLLNIDPVATNPGYVSANSGNISIAVPDNIADGATSILTVPPLPAGATVTGIAVSFSMTHTYPGDMIFNLQAPNNKILNLYKYNGGTYTGNAGNLQGAGWFNAITSSAATVDYSSVPAPYAYGSVSAPGPFKADALNSNISTSEVQNPTGYVSAAAGFSDLFSIPAGTWTLAMADGGPGDLGALTNWSITIFYTTSSTAYPAVWKPISTLYSDAAATIAYDGVTPLFKVYAKPDLTTTYTALSVNNGCVSASSAAITLTVNNPILITGQPANTTICEFGTTSFTAAARGTIPSYQWLVNNGSGIYSPINNNPNYSGVTTDTLTVKDAPYSWNGYQYRCVVTSAAPCTTFDTTLAAVLKINPTPVIKLTATPYTKLLPGLNSTLSVTATPAAASYLWYKNDIALPSVTTDKLNVSVDELGAYKVAVTDINGCSNTSDMLSMEDSISGRLFVFPNPNKGQFQVRYYSVPGNAPLPRTLVIYDAKGALVYNKIYAIGKPYDKMEVNFRAFGKGLYFINLLDVTGKRIAIGKVVVQ